MKLPQRSRKELLFLSVNFILTIILLYEHTQIPETQGCKVTDRYGTVMEGNCSFVMPNYCSRRYSYIIDTNNTITLRPEKEPVRIVCPSCDCPICTCPNITCPEITCPPCTCPECPPLINCPDRFTIDTIKAALNYKPTPSAILPYQTGANDCKDFYLDLFDVPNRSRFRSRVSLDTLRPRESYGGFVNDSYPDAFVWHFNFSAH